MKLPDIIGIAGTNGSGKDSLALLRERLDGSLNISLSDILRREATRRGQEPIRENLGAISTEWENEIGDGALVQKTLDFYQQERGGKGGLSISSVRRESEARAIKLAGGIIIWVDAYRHTRYERLRHSRGRLDDMVSFEQFCQIEDDELYNKAGVKGALAGASVRDVADVVIDNNFPTKEAYEAYLIDYFELEA